MDSGIDKTTESEKALDAAKAFFVTSTAYSQDAEYHYTGVTLEEGYLIMITACQMNPGDNRCYVALDSDYCIYLDPVFSVKKMQRCGAVEFQPNISPSNKPTKSLP